MNTKPTLSLPDRLNMTGRRVLITGGASGMGQATALILAEMGAEVVIADIQPATRTLEMLAEKGLTATAMQGNLADDAFLDSLIAAGPWFALAHCAAIFKPPADMDPVEGFELLMRINVRASQRLATGVIEGMAARREGFVVMVGSAAGQNGGIMTDNSERYYAEYAASKGGMHTLVKWLARRAVKHNVLVNGIAPGLVTSPLNANAGIVFTPENFFMPLGRPGQPVDLGWPIAMLCTPAASFIAGVVLDVNGGSYVP